MPENEVVSPVPSVNSNPPISSNRFLSRKLLIISLFLVALLFIAIFALAYLSKKTVSPIDAKILALSQQLSQSGEGVVFTEPLVTGLLNISKEKDVGKQYKIIFNTSVGVASQYSTSKNPKLRKFMDSLNLFAKSNFPSEYRESDFYLLCLDTECATSSMPPEISEIKSKIENSELGPNKKSMLTALDNGSLVVDNPQTEAERNRQVDSYTFVYQLLRLEAQSGNQAALAIADSLEKYLVEKLNIDVEKLKSRLPG